MTNTARTTRLGALHGRRASIPALALALLGAACAGAGPIGSIALEAGRKFLMSTAQENFGDGYTSDFGRLIDILAFKTVAGVTPGATPTNGDEGAAAEPAAAPGVSQPAPDPTPAPLEPIELEVLIVREVVVDGSPLPIPVDDGAVVRDGVGREGDGDNLRVRFKTNVACHVYAVWVDATAWATPVFPMGPGYTLANPVQPRATQTLPDGGGWFYLDDYRGVETLYVVASREPLPDLEGVLAELATQERSFRADVDRPVTVAHTDEITRGLAGVRPGKTDNVLASDGTAHSVRAPTFVSEIAAGDLVVTRWVRHE